jgi:hypothetical protein
MRTVEAAVAVGVAPFCAKTSPKAASPRITNAATITTKRMWLLSKPKAAARVDHVQKKFRDDDGPPIGSVHIRTRGGVAANLAAWRCLRRCARLVAGQQLKIVAPTTHSHIGWLGSAQPGPWRTETAMEQALSPPLESLPRPRSGQRDQDHRMSSSGPWWLMLKTTHRENDIDDTVLPSLTAET